MVTAIIQARMSSTRLPGKVLKVIDDRPMLFYMLERVAQAQQIDQVVLATSSEKEDDEIVDFCRRQEVLCFRGNLDDVLDRYYQAAKSFNGDPVVRLTADCPIIDPQVIDSLIEIFKDGQFDYVANTCPPEGMTYPEGMDVEIFSFHALEKAWKETVKPSDREHVTFYFWKNPNLFSIFRHDLHRSFADYRLTVDYPQDFDAISRILNHFYPERPFFTMEEVIAYLDEHPDIKSLNDHIESFSGWQSAFEKDREFT